jgi:hypothetical protein
MKFLTNISPHFALHSGYKENYIEEIMNIIFFGLLIESHTNWWNVMEEMIPRRSGACYAVRSMVYVRNINNIKSIYFAYFHSVTKYRTIFLGNSTNSGKIFA